MSNKFDFKDSILTLLNQRAPGKSICPSEVLDVNQKKDKEIMKLVRKSAIELVHQGLIDITQKGVSVNPDNFKGPIRLIKKIKIKM